MSPSGEGRLQAVLERVARSPVLLLAFALCASAIVSPYAGLTHDAVPYSLQVLDRLDLAGPRSLHHDLFLSYGSQDRFSIFSLILAPLVRQIGLHLAFLLAYLVAIAFFFEGVRRLMAALFEMPALVAAATLFVAVSPLAYGGLSVFHVAEPFTTPRLFASGLTLWALEQMLRQRWLMAIAFLSCAAALHPLMAAAGGGVMAGTAVSRHIGLRATCAVAAAVVAILIAGVVLGLTPGAATLDDTWRGVIRQAAPYNFPDEWRWMDWVGVVGSIWLVTFGAWQMRRQWPTAATLLSLSAVAAAAGLALTVIAARSSNVVLFQVQPYRALWLVGLLQVPVALLLIETWLSGSSGRRLAAVGLVLYLDISYFVGQRALLAGGLFLLLIAAAFVRGPVQSGAVKNAAWRAAAAGVALTAGTVLFSLVRTEREAGLDPAAMYRVMVMAIGPIALLSATVAAVVVLERHVTRRGALVATLLGVWGASEVVAFAVPRTVTYQRKFGQMEAERALAAHIARRSELGRPVRTVYTNWADPTFLWNDLGVASYFSLPQVVGVMFSRETAREAVRRARLVAPFEAVREATPAAHSLIGHLMRERLFQPGGSSDWSVGVRSLCEDVQLDVIAVTTRRDAGTLVSTDLLIADCEPDHSSASILTAPAWPRPIDALPRSGGQ